MGMNELEGYVPNGRQIEQATHRLYKKIYSTGVVIGNDRLENMSVSEFAILIVHISDEYMGKLICHCFENRQFNRIFKQKTNEVAKWAARRVSPNEIAKHALWRIAFWKDGFRELWQKVQAEQSKTQAGKETAVGQSEQTDEVDNHIMMQTMKTYYPAAYAAINRGLTAKAIIFESNYFNFRCDKGCVGLIFREAGYTEYKQISRYILINGEKPKENTLKNCTKNTPPKEWENIKLVFFPDNPKTTPK